MLKAKGVACYDSYFRVGTRFLEKNTPLHLTENALVIQNVRLRGGSDFSGRLLLKVECIRDPTTFPSSSTFAGRLRSCLKEADEQSAAEGLDQVARTSTDLIYDVLFATQDDAEAALKALPTCEVNLNGGIFRFSLTEWEEEGKEENPEPTRNCGISAAYLLVLHQSTDLFDLLQICFAAPTTPAPRRSPTSMVSTFTQFFDLPVETQLSILAFLPFQTIARLARTAWKGDELAWPYLRSKQFRLWIVRSFNRHGRATSDFIDLLTISTARVQIRVAPASTVYTRHFEKKKKDRYRYDFGAAVCIPVVYGRIRCFDANPMTEGGVYDAASADLVASRGIPVVVSPELLIEFHRASEYVYVSGPNAADPPDHGYPLRGDGNRWKEIFMTPSLLHRIRQNTLPSDTTPRRALNAFSLVHPRHRSILTHTLPSVKPDPSATHLGGVMRAVTDEAKAFAVLLDSLSNGRIGAAVRSVIVKVRAWRRVTMNFGRFLLAERDALVHAWEDLERATQGRVFVARFAMGHYTFLFSVPELNEIIEDFELAAELLGIETGDQ
ncbi:hypothetical protein HK104_005537 [Borealophlyctis nickersoniae]|nr:hypothetical protein HK104_005537 [Borealophlyctis nickersoniae]